MKLAVIAPPSYLGRVRGAELGYHMALGQELVRDTTYYKFYQTLASYGHFIIVDNGAAESEEERVAFEGIVDVAVQMKADEIILPDKLRDSKWTVKHSLAALPQVPRRKRFVVPQGENWDEWTLCLEELVLFTKPVTIGLAKWLEELPGGRARAMDVIVRAGYQEQYNIHMLGIHSKPIAEAKPVAEVFPDVRGIDTGAPIAYAQHNETISDENHFSLDWNRPAPAGFVGANIRVYNELLAYMGGG